MFKNEKVKKIVIVVLFLLVIGGLVGYGVYSFEYTSGTYVTASTISIGAFDPQTIIDDTASFLGDGGTVTLTCPEIVTGNESTYCTGSVIIKNNGDGPIFVEINGSDAEESGEYEESYAGEGTTVDNNNDFFNVAAESPVFDWYSKVLAAKESAVLNISVPIQVSSSYGNENYPTSFDEFSGPYEGSSAHLIVDFKVRASQYLGE